METAFLKSLQIPRSQTIGQQITVTLFHPISFGITTELNLLKYFCLIWDLYYFWYPWGWVDVIMNIIFVKSANMTQLFCRRKTLIWWFKFKHLLGTKSFIFCTISVSISSRRCILSCILKQSKRCMKKEWLEFPAKYTWWACKYDCCLIFSPFNCGVLGQAKWKV